jgi:hypothetical protein
MKVIKWLANFTISAIVLFVTLYFVISLCVAFFKLFGWITEGQPMLFELRTPSWVALLTFQASCVAILVGGFFLRRKLRRRLVQTK